MRILVAQDTFLPRIGGAEIHAFKLAQALQARGHHVEVATSVGGSPTIDGLSVHRFPGLVSQGKRSMLWLPFYLPALVALARDVDVVHGHYSAFMSALFAMLCRLLGKPFVVTLHGYGTLDSSVSSTRWLRIWRVIALRLARRVIATSDEMAQLARRFVPAGRVVTISNGVDTRDFTTSVPRPANGPVRVAAVRRLVEKNGVQYLVQAAPAILKNSPRPVEFWIIGDGKLRGWLENRVQELGIGSAVRFLGGLDNDKVREVLAEVDILVFPSSAESTSIAALEGMAAAKPIVASAVGGYPALLGNDERGLLVELFDRPSSDYNAPLTLPDDRAAALSAGVVSLIRDPERARQFGERARRYVEANFDWRALTERIEAVYVAAGACAR